MVMVRVKVGIHYATVRGCTYNGLYSVNTVLAHLLLTGSDT